MGAWVHDIDLASDNTFVMHYRALSSPVDFSQHLIGTTIPRRGVGSARFRSAARLKGNGSRSPFFCTHLSHSLKRRAAKTKVNSTSSGFDVRLVSHWSGVQQQAQDLENEVGSSRACRAGSLDRGDRRSRFSDQPRR
jgi:hypothetical protein